MWSCEDHEVHWALYHSEIPSLALLSEEEEDGVPWHTRDLRHHYWTLSYGPTPPLMLKDGDGMFIQYDNGKIDG